MGPQSLFRWKPWKTGETRRPGWAPWAVTHAPRGGSGLALGRTFHQAGNEGLARTRLTRAAGLSRDSVRCRTGNGGSGWFQSLRQGPERRRLDTYEPSGRLQGPQAFHTWRSSSFPEYKKKTPASTGEAWGSQGTSGPFPCQVFRHRLKVAVNSS